MTASQIEAGLKVWSEESGIPMEQLMKMRREEIESVHKFVRIKLDLKLAASQAERERLEAEAEAWTNAHPLWRAHLEQKGKL